MRDRQPRYFQAMHVRVATPQGPVGARLDNLSATGARLRGVGAVQKGERVALGLKGRGVVGTVVWRKGALAGIHFDSPLTAQHLRAILGPEVPLRVTAAPAAAPNGPVKPRPSPRSYAAGGP